jgi:hypothetical protein
MVKNGGFPFGDMRCVCVIYMVILCMVYSQEGDEMQNVEIL